MPSLILFAEGGGNDVNAFTVCMAVVASIGAVTSSIINYLSGRDKLRFDAEQALLKQKVESLEGDVSECHEDRAKANERIDQLEERAARAEALARAVADEKRHERKPRGSRVDDTSERSM